MTYASLQAAYPGNDILTSDGLENAGRPVHGTQAAAERRHVEAGKQEDGECRHRRGDHEILLQIDPRAGRRKEQGEAEVQNCTAKERLWLFVFARLLESYVLL